MASLYRTYRPTTFDEVVGQDHVVRTLRAAVEGDRIAHAYLFSGPRGTGKTSMAKLLAKALNCQRSDGPTATPCGECESCRSIHDATALDVHELDAASHRGIDDMRALLERVGTQPIAGRRKVYILDEAHSLTAEASNALLKTLEEPPSHVVFVLCTTDPAKLLPTIRSRCQRFAFRRPGPAELVTLLRTVCEREGIAIDEEALRLIARAGAGSYRDALTTLDQIATGAGGQVDAARVGAVLGVVGEGALGQIVDAVARGDAGGLLGLVDELAEAGESMDGLVRSLLEHLRLLYLLQHAGALPASEATSPDHLAELERQAATLTAEEVVRTIDLLAAALGEIREGSEPRLPLEVALLKATRPDTQRSTEALLARVERLEGALSGTAAPPPPPTPAPGAAEVATAPAAPPPPAPAAPSAPPAGSLDALRAEWGAVVGAAKGPLLSVMTGSRPLALEGSQLTVAVKPTFVSMATQHTEEVAAAIAAACALRVEPRFVAAPEGDAPPAPSPEPAAEEPARLDEGTFVSRFHDQFDATEVDA